MPEAIRVLHVDDEPDFAEMAASFLERERDRLTVESATDPIEALDMIEQQDFDCVIADYDMPKQNGIELLQTLREEHTDLPVIIYTGKGSEDVASTAIAEGVTDYIPKEFDEDIYQLLADRITEAIEHRRARVNYEQIFEKIPDGIVVHDPETFEFVDMNRKFAEMYGYESKDEFLEAGFESIHFGEPPYTMEKAREHVRNAIDEGPQTFEWHVVRKDGSDFWAEVHLTPIQLHGALRILAAVRDVTDRHEYETELERTNERLDEFASIVSHDLQNPLTVAEGHVELLQEQYDDESLDAVVRAHERMRTLIDDLLTLTRGDAAMTVQDLSLADVIESCWRNVRTDTASLVIESDQRIRADQSRLQQLLENLIRNAVEHAGETPTVTVGSIENGFYIADDGPGIPAEDREAVFEVGYTTSSEGTGYGLKIVEEIAAEHGWEITVTESETGGARIEFTGVDQAT